MFVARPPFCMYWSEVIDKHCIHSYYIWLQSRLTGFRLVTGLLYWLVIGWWQAHLTGWLQTGYWFPVQAGYRLVTSLLYWLVTGWLQDGYRMVTGLLYWLDSGELEAYLTDWLHLTDWLQAGSRPALQAGCIVIIFNLTLDVITTSLRNYTLSHMHTLTSSQIFIHSQSHTQCHYHTYLPIHLITHIRTVRSTCGGFNVFKQK